ncbi:hypothetical protein HOY80DRAFT_896968, partial [Tuber brumale]
QLVTTLYFLGSFSSSTVKGAVLLGIGEGTVHLYCHRIIIALVHLSSCYIRWPPPRSSDKIEQESGFPGCAGYLDGSDIVLQYGPSFHGESYFNRKKRYGLNIQGICYSQ